jgi:hypothetical protein
MPAPNIFMLSIQQFIQDNTINSNIYSVLIQNKKQKEQKQTK